ncbi:tetratricopeptide repeat protein, partial [Brachyspira pulli]|uniref:tetratricopeptide repeat protein n=2 Tax=Brachyspira pulli TaxID=310721 RepID=UPI0030064252
MSIINYFFEKHLERCKKESENFENNKFKEVREDLRVETRKYIEEINNFFSSINAESFTDFNGFNSKIKTFNDELNRIMKASANISTLVYVIQNVSEDDFYTYTDFISYFSYDENKFNNASEIDTKNLKRLDKFLERADDDFELYKERGDLRAELGLYNEAIDDYKKALELKPNYDEAKNALEEINKKLTNTKTVNKKSKINNYIKDNNTQNKKSKINNYIKDNNTQNKKSKTNNYIKDNNTQNKKSKTNNYIKDNNTQNKESKKYYEEGINYHKEEKYEEAIKYYNKAIELASNYTNAYFARGLAKENLGQHF